MSASAILTLLSAVATCSILALNAWLNRRKLEADALAILERESKRAEQVLGEHALAAIALDANLRRIRREQHTPHDAWRPRIPQDATPEQWAARHPQDVVVGRSVWPAQPTEGENHE